MFARAATAAAAVFAAALGLSLVAAKSSGSKREDPQEEEAPRPPATSPPSPQQQQQQQQQQPSGVASVSDLASAIRGSVCSLADAEAFVARGGLPQLPPSSRPPGLAIYPGSFNPPSRVHVEIAAALSRIEGVDAVWLDMTVHKDASKSKPALDSHDSHSARARLPRNAAGARSPRRTTTPHDLASAFVTKRCE